MVCFCLSLTLQRYDTNWWRHDQKSEVTTLGHPDDFGLPDVRISRYLNHDDVIKWKHFSPHCPLCEESICHGEFPSQRPVTREFDVFFDLRMNKWLSKPSRRRWCETPWRSLWRHCNVDIWQLLSLYAAWLCHNKVFLTHTRHQAKTT